MQKRKSSKKREKAIVGSGVGTRGQRLAFPLDMIAPAKKHIRMDLQQDVALARSKFLRWRKQFDQAPEWPPMEES